MFCGRGRGCCCCLDRLSFGVSDIVCPTMKMNIGFVRRRTVKFEFEWIPPGVTAIEALLCEKVSTSRKRRKNARKRERQNENQP